MLRTETKVAVASGIARVLVPVRRMVGLGAIADVERGKVRWRLDLTEGIDLAIFLFGVFEKDTVEQFRRWIRPGATVLDIGANIGAHTLQLARLVGDIGRVIAFEPTDYAFEKLRFNLSLNPALQTRVVAEQTMLLESDRGEGPSELFSSWPLSSSSKGLHPRHFGRSMTCDGASRTTLDAYVAGAGLSSVSLIKLDVDGHEWAVLKGAAGTIERFRPPIIMEMAPYVLDEVEGRFEAVLEILERADYELRSFPSNRPLELRAEEIRRAVPDGCGINVLARPKETAAIAGCR